MLFPPSAVGHLLVDDRLVVRFVDARGPEVLLHDRDALLGRVVTDFLDPPLRSDVALLLDAVFGDGVLRDVQLRWHRPEGVPLVTDATLSLYTDADIRRVVMASWRPPLDTPIAIHWRRAQMLLGALRKGRVGFGDQIIGTASAEMLLILYLDEVQGVASLAGALVSNAGMTWTTGRRWIDILVHSGVIEIDGPAETLAGRTALRLTAMGESKVVELLDGFASPPGDG